MSEAIAEVESDAESAKRFYLKSPGRFGVVRHTNQEFMVIGEPMAFYIFIWNGGAQGRSCNTLRGRPGEYQNLLNLWENRQRRKFADTAQRLFKQHNARPNKHRR